MIECRDGEVSMTIAIPCRLVFAAFIPHLFRLTLIISRPVALPIYLSSRFHYPAHSTPSIPGPYPYRAYHPFLRRLCRLRPRQLEVAADRVVPRGRRGRAGHFLCCGRGKGAQIMAATIPNSKLRVINIHFKRQKANLILGSNNTFCVYRMREPCLRYSLFEI